MTGCGWESQKNSEPGCGESEVSGDSGLSIPDGSLGRESGGIFERREQHLCSAGISPTVSPESPPITLKPESTGSQFCAVSRAVKLVPASGKTEIAN